MNEAVGVAPVTYCSIATPSHLRQVLTCLDSIRQHHPLARYVVLLIHAPAEAVPPVPGISFLRIEDCIAAAQLRAMAQRYTGAELCFAAKPYLMRALLGTAGQVHYFDGDCLAFSSTAPLLAALEQADVLLTPHSLSPIPDDGHGPRPLTILRAGAFNAGYLGVRATAQGREFLDWLAAMTFCYARNDPRAGMCGDQKWLDLAPALFPGMAICRHWGANVGYWNLHERTLRCDAAGQWLVNDQPLIFFHFSGYNPDVPAQLSKYQDRHSVLPGSVLEKLLQAYRMRIGTSDNMQYGMHRFLSRLLRRMRG